MGAVERCVYFELLMLQAVTGPFTWEPARIARQVRLSQAEVEQAWPGIQRCFTQDAEGRWSNAKLALVLERGEGNYGGTAQRRRGQARAQRAERDRTGRFTPAMAGAGWSLAGPATEKLEPETKKPPSQTQEAALFGAEVLAVPPPAKRRSRPETTERQAINRAFAGWWEETWEAGRGEPWRWSAKERSAVNALAGLAGAGSGSMTAVLAAMQARAENMLAIAAQDAFVAQNAAPSLLVGRWNQYAAVVQKLPPSKSQRLLQDLANRMEKRNGTA